MDEAGRLDSWKQIASYLGKSERTVRRWQQVEGLPIHRHLHQQRGSVWAYQRDLDEWLASRKDSPQPLIEEPDRQLWTPFARRLWMLTALATIGPLVYFVAGRQGKAGKPSQIQFGEPEPLTSLPGADYGAAFSPDGKTVAFYWNRGPDGGGIYTKQLGTVTVQPLAVPKNGDFLYGPAWSPDGKTIAYLRRTFPTSGLSIHTTGNETWLCLIDAHGGPERRLMKVSESTVFYANNANLSWSPDGKRILAPVSAARRRGIHWIPVDEAEPVQLTNPPDYDWAPTPSPDASGFVFLRQEGAMQAAIENLFYQALTPAGAPRGEPRLLTKTRSQTSGIAWMPNGSELLICRGFDGIFTPFHTRLYRLSTAVDSVPEPLPISNCNTLAIASSRENNPTMLAYGDTGNNSCSLWQASLDALKDAQPFAESSRYDLVPAYSPDGSQIAFMSNRAGPAEIWVAASDGTTERRLTQNANASSTPRWSPDGRRLVYGAVTPNVKYGVFIVPVAGGSPVEVPTGGRTLTDPSWSVDGESLYAWSGQQLWQIRPDGSAAKLIREFPAHWLRAGSVGGRSGKELFYVRAGSRQALVGADIETGKESLVADDLVTGFFAVSRRFIYVIKRTDGQDQLLAAPLSGGALRLVGNLPFKSALQYVMGLTVSPDDRKIMWAIANEQRFDLMLVRQMR